VAELDEELDRLYGLPLADFTKARNELAARLQKEGNSEGADRVKGLKKPTVPAWVLNQLAHRRSEDVRALLDAGAAVRRAHEAALRGEGAATLHEATTAHRAAVRELVHAAREITDDGRPPSQATLDRVSESLSIAAVDDEAGTLLESGRIEREFTSRGFDVFTGMPLPTSTAPPRRQPAEKTRARTAQAPAKDDLAERRERRAAEQERVTQLRAEVRELQRKATAANRERARADREAERAQREADRLRRQAELAAERRRRVVPDRGLREPVGRADPPAPR
jgi:hypothetical protein